MTLQIRVRNFAGLERADFETDGIVLCSGGNGAGKSSLCQALQAALTGNPMARGVTTKKAAPALVRTGADAASVTVKSDKGAARVSWPDCETSGDGRPPAASPYACGAVSIMALDDKARGKALSEILRAEPTREELAKALADAEIGKPEQVKAVWDLVEDQGWDGAHAKAKARGATLKGQWIQATGEKGYGAKAAAGWLPQGHDETLRERARDALEEACTEARRNHERVVARAALGEDELRRLKDLAGSVAECEQALKDAGAVVRKAEKDREAALAALAELPPDDDRPGLACPHCGGQVRQTTDPRTAVVQLVKVDAADLSPKELKDRRMARAGAEGRVERARGAANAAIRAQSEAEIQLQRARDAAAELAAAEKRTAGGAGTDEVEAARQALARADATLTAYTTLTTADKLHRAIKVNQAVIDVLAPEGLRKTKLGRVLDDFNARLSALCAKGGMPAVSIDEGLAARFGNRLYGALSESERYRADAVLQIAIAEREGADMLVFDRLDVLQPQLRGPFLQMVRAAGIPAVVAMTAADPAKAPDIAAAKWGATYWLEKGLLAARDDAIEALREEAA